LLNTFEIIGHLGGVGLSSNIKKSEEEIKKIERAGRIVAGCHDQLSKMLKVGLKTKEIDHFIDWYLTENGAIPAQKGYRGYPFASCISVNEVACHGFPSQYELQDGDIVTIDFVADVDGWKADSARTYIIGKASEEAQRLVRSAQAALQAGLKAAKAGNSLAMIGQAIEERASADGYRVITAFAGHGIGQQLHEPPQVLHSKLPQPHFILEEGMVITIEPILSAGSVNTYIAPDGWTARTVDHSLTAQFEHTIAITKGKPKILTALPPARSKGNERAKSRAKRVKAEQSNNVPSSKAQSSKVGTSKLDPSKVGSSKVGSNKTQSNKAQPSKSLPDMAKANIAQSSTAKPIKPDLIHPSIVKGSGSASSVGRKGSNAGAASDKPSPNKRHRD